jgi:hypothetical protein
MPVFTSRVPDPWILMRIGKIGTAYQNLYNLVPVQLNMSQHCMMIQ